MQDSDVMLLLEHGPHLLEPSEVVLARRRCEPHKAEPHVATLVPKVSSQPSSQSSSTSTCKAMSSSRLPDMRVSLWWPGDSHTVDRRRGRVARRLPTAPGLAQAAMGVASDLKVLAYLAQPVQQLDPRGLERRQGPRPVPTQRTHQLWLPFDAAAWPTSILCRLSAMYCNNSFCRASTANMASFC
jgi:hypothetical protein